MFCCGWFVKWLDMVDEWKWRIAGRNRGRRSRKKLRGITSMSRIVGIDFGSMNTTVAYVDGDGIIKS